jgi:hypothetical protein
MMRLSEGVRHLAGVPIMNASLNILERLPS